ncbi:MAG: WSC domain-containing protein [Ruminococcus sp.]|nr:WSC domain-containing protein [Ruminococcus sp.]
MKNNKITFSQFVFSCFLATLSVLLFIDYNPSLLFFGLIVLALLIDTAVVFFYNGNSVILKTASFLFLSFMSVIICIEFCRYMYYDLGYGPFWVLVIIVFGFTFFSTVKGLEALSRASVIITFFIVFSLIFISVSSFGNIKFTIKLNEIKSIIVPLILLFPSAIYILNNDNIIKEKKFSFNVYTLSLFAILIYYHMLPKDRISVGIFKGADGLLLAVLTVSVIYFISSSAVACFKHFGHRYISNALYLSAIAVVSISSFYLFS